jgi:type II secretion system protein J
MKSVSLRDKSATNRIAQRRAFTLVELLVALALAALLVVGTGRVTISAMQTQKAVEEKIQERARGAQVLDALARDWSRRTAALPGEESSLRLVESASSTLEFACLAPVASDELHVALLPGTVRYRVASEEREAVLVREVIGATAPGHPMRRERLAKEVAEFNAEVWVDGRWVKSFPVAKNRQTNPRMLRVTLRFEGQSKALRRSFEMKELP